MAKFYITTAIPYVNAPPHVGHALEFVQADVIKRFRKILGDDVLLLSGGDENALKNVQAAEEEGTPIQDFVDKNSKLFADLAKKLNIEFDVFQKGSDPKHHESSQRLWKLCKKDIYEETYTGLYCVGCEQFYEPEELNEKGECFEHPGKPLEKVSEKNYFFNLKKYEGDLKRIINDKNDSNYIEIIPEKRRHEVQSFLELGLKDISISRSNERAKNWGVTVPGNPNQKIYVWFDALNIYRSGIEDRKDREWWPADVHVIGKGITRFHAIYWPAFLLSAGLKLPKTIFVHGYLTVDGQKMSKTLGNVIDPVELIDTYEADTLRYYFLREIPATEDGDFSEKKLKELYNADLANGLGNLVARIAKLCENEALEGHEKNDLSLTTRTGLSLYSFNIALEEINKRIRSLDQFLNDRAPWNIENKTELNEVLKRATDELIQIASDLQPFLPKTAEKILKQFSGKIKSTPPLFPRQP